MRGEGLDQVSTGFLKSLGAAEFSGVRLNQHRSEVVLSDQDAELVRSIDCIVTGDGIGKAFPCVPVSGAQDSVCF